MKRIQELCLNNMIALLGSPYTVQAPRKLHYQNCGRQLLHRNSALIVLEMDERLPLQQFYPFFQVFLCLMQDDRQALQLPTQIESYLLHTDDSPQSKTSQF